MRRLVVPALVVAVVVILAAAVLYTVVICACQQPITPTFGPVVGDNPQVDRREILFMSNRDGDWDVYVMSLGDRSVTNLTNNDADDGFASYSADGGAITFLSNRGGKLDPYMMNADGSSVRAVANDLPTILSVITSGRLNWDTISRAPGQTALVSLRDLNLEVYAQDASGEHNLTRNGAVDWFPAWSPDQNQFAFASDRDGNQEIYLMDADGGNPRRLTNAPGDDLYPMWWQYHNEIVFMSDRDTPFAHGQIGLYAINLDNAGLQADRVGSDAIIDRLDPQVWQENQSQIYASQTDGDWDIYYSDNTGRYTANLTDNDADDLFAVWRPQPSSL